MQNQAVFHGRTGCWRARLRPAWAAWTSAAGLGASLPAQASPTLGTQGPAGVWLLGAGLALLWVVLTLALVCWLNHRAHPARQTFEGIDTAPWPALTAFVAVRAQDPVISNRLQALLDTDYPPDRLRIVPIIEPGDVASRAIISAYAHLFPDRIVPCQRSAGQPTWAQAALHETLGLAQGDLAVWLDVADTQRPGLFKQLVKPFFDPEVGAVTGRVAPPQGERWLSQTLSRLGLWPRARGGPAASRFNGAAHRRTWCALRLSAVEAAGGWRNGPSSAHPGQTAHTEQIRHICQRLQAHGWITLADHRALCAPAATPARVLAPDGGAVPPGRGRVAEAAALRPRPAQPAESVQPAEARPRTSEPSLNFRALRAVVEPA